MRRIHRSIKNVITNIGLLLSVTCAELIRKSFLRFSRISPIRRCCIEVCFTLFFSQLRPLSITRFHDAFPYYRDLQQIQRYYFHYVPSHTTRTCKQVLTLVRLTTIAVRRTCHKLSERSTFALQQFDYGSTTALT